MRRFYGIMESQFHKHFVEAERRGGVTGDNLLQILESRLDNVVYRMGFADSRKQARQLVRHGHFMVNDRKTNIPSFLVKPGDVVTVRPGSRGRTYFTDYGEVLDTRRAPDWMTIDSADAQRQDSQSAGSRPDRGSVVQRSVGRGALQPLDRRRIRAGLSLAHRMQLMEALHLVGATTISH